jgi:cytidine deaminase
MFLNVKQEYDIGRMDIEAFIAKEFAELSDDQKTVVESASEAISTSFSPYSKFKVGSALLLANGKIIKGSNQENIAYPSGICAERAALFAYGSSGVKDKISKLAVVAQHHGDSGWAIGAPCGACRQVMLEYESMQQDPFEVIFHYDDKFIVASSARDLLPFHFHM